MYADRTTTLGVERFFSRPTHRHVGFGFMIPHCGIGCAKWKKRNSRSFEDKYSSFQKIKMNYLILFDFWSREEFLDGEPLLKVIESLYKEPKDTGFYCLSQKNSEDLI